MSEDAARTIDVFRALAHPTRRRMLELIAAGDEVPRGSLEEATGLPADMASYHLRVLVVADVVELRRRGRKVCYALRRDTVSEVVDRLTAFSASPVQRTVAPALEARPTGAHAGSR